ncbi:uncharacterized protein LOC126106822 [Schistocerca cancellata]|uniref:uncharacterized protein LOC126106822 n=1 Tax=Schistocerca cancellata TaxID=274614 RepID=UPI002118E5A5|nr:uncharacterized protein LOC126106822 [Schistocerca cancellata]
MTSRRVRYAAALVIVMKNVKKKKRSIWVREWIMRRSQYGAYNNLLQELSIESMDTFENFCRVSSNDLECLLTLIAPVISKRDTKFRTAISAKERLLVTLRFIATGDSYKSLMYLFRIPVSTISMIVPDVCRAIFDVLKRENYLKTPGTTSEWMQVAKGFEENWNFPHCIGALDGKHIVMQAPKDSGSCYYNYKHCHSVVLLALVDTSYKLLYMDVGCNGRVSDGGVFSTCFLSSALEQGHLDIPLPKPLPGREKDTPFVIIADDAFPMRSYLMKPYPFHNQPGPNRVFNYRLSRARRVVENFFGHIAQRFRILRRPLLLGPEKTVTIVSAICALHNFLMDRKDGSYANRSNFDVEDVQNGEVIGASWRNEEQGTHNLIPIQTGQCNRNSHDTRAIREEFMNYFVSPLGEVPWQYRYI